MDQTWGLTCRQLYAESVAAFPAGCAPYWVAPNFYLRKAGHTAGFWPLMCALAGEGPPGRDGPGPSARSAVRRPQSRRHRVVAARGENKGARIPCADRSRPCPLAEHQSEQTARKAGRPVRGPRTLQAIAETYLTLRQVSWASAKHRQQWENTLNTYVYPSLGDLPIGRINTDAMLDRLTPLWAAKPETASRVRGRIETIINTARHAAGSWREPHGTAISCCHPVRGSPGQASSGDALATFRPSISALSVTATYRRSVCAT